MHSSKVAPRQQPLVRVRTSGSSKYGEDVCRTSPISSMRFVAALPGEAPHLYYLSGRLLVGICMHPTAACSLMGWPSLDSLF